MLEIRESLEWKRPGDARSALAEQQRQAFERIDDRFSEVLIVRRTDRYGNTGYPWEYPFDRDEDFEGGDWES